MQKRFPAEPHRLNDIREFVKQHMAPLAFPRRTVQEVALAVSEACANVIRHTKSPETVVTLVIDRDRVHIEVSDSGVFGKPVPSEALPERGWGIPIMRSLMDSVWIHKGTPQDPGTVVRLVKHKRVAHSASREGRHPRRRRPEVRPARHAARTSAPGPPDPRSGSA